MPAVSEPEALWICARVDQQAEPLAPAFVRPCTECRLDCWVSVRQSAQGLPGRVVCYDCASELAGVDVRAEAVVALARGQRDFLGRLYFEV